MTIVLGVLLGLLSTLGAVAHAMTISRQRTIAVSLAKQAIENIQGADWANVATGTGVTTADPLVTPGTPLKFGGEDLFFGGTSPYRTYPVAAGATFVLTTFVTTVPPAGGKGTGYRHVTVIVGWPSTNPAHTMQFSSLIFPLDYTSYPAGNGTAEVTDGLVTLSGCLGGDTFDDVHVALPGARADTIASTLRTAIGSANSAAAHVEVHPRLDSSTCVPVDPVAADNCPRVNLTNVADNDSSTSTLNTASGTGGSFLCPLSPTAGGLAVVVPPAVPTSLSSDAKTDVCSPTCAFAGAVDTVPFADAAVTPTAGSSATFNSGGLTGGLWSFASGWSATTRVDHDTISSTSGSVTTSASLIAPALSILSLPGAPGGTVKVAGFTATASASAGYTTTAPNLIFGTTLQLWNGSGYGPIVVVAPGTSWSGTSSFPAGDRQVSLVATVQTQPLLLVTVAVIITPSTLDAAPGVGTDNFTIEVNYGRVAANSAWLTKAA
jgi:hypothetical protein